MLPRRATTTLLEIIHHPGGAAAIAVDARQRICLIRQYRHAAGGWLWELPAGRREEEEDPQTTARRELAEEAGVQAGSLSSLGLIHPSPGIFTEVIHLYLAQALTPCELNHETSEVIEVHWLAREQIQTMICNGEITDAKTLVALLKYFHCKKQE